MRRSRFSVYATANEPRWIVLYGPQHQVLDCQRLEPAADLSGAMSAAIDRLSAEGWQAEGTAAYGFVFVRREGERRLLMMAERDPMDTAASSFSPFS